MMKQIKANIRRSTWLLILTLMLTAALPCRPADAQTTGQSGRGQYVSIDFNNVDINVFIKFISELTGKNFIVDNTVKGKVTVISPSKISVDEAYKVFESVLEVHGFATVQAGEVIKIVTAPDARSKNIETMLRQEAASPEDKVVTQIIPLQYADANDIMQLFRPLVSKNSVILPYPPTNMLIVTDVYSNITRLLRILDAIDIIGIGQEISVIPLEYGDATKMVRLLNTVFQTQQRGKKQPAAVETAKFVDDERTNSIVVLASEDDTAKIKALIQLLDKEVPKGKERIHVYYLENATAEELATVLQSLSGKTGSTAEKGKKEAPIVSDKVTITADKATNSLIIMAEKEEYMVLEEIIKKLDIRRAMVYIECLIMEVNVNNDFNLGSEWLAFGEAAHDGTDGGYGGGFSGGGDVPFANSLGLITPNEAGVGSLPAGFSLGVFSEVIQIGDVMFPNLAAIAKAYKKDKNVNILSTPQLLTTDNEEASITVGKNIPYQTKTGTTTTSETYNTYEYKDVGISLKVTPQISKDRVIRLQITQEVTKLDELLTTGEERPTTLKRSVETTVIVNDKGTVAIGGLIDDSITNTENKIPCLGEIPGLGWMFKSVSDSREKTNLYIFLTPHVIENPMEAEDLYQKKKQEIDAIEEGQIKMYKEKKGVPADVSDAGDAEE